MHSTLSGLISILVLAQLAGTAGSEPSTDGVAFEAWSALLRREADVRSVDVAWTESLWWRRHATVDPQRLERLIPAQDSKGVARYRLVIDGDRVRADGVYDAPTLSGVESFTRVEAFDGEEARFFYERAEPFGEIRQNIFASLNDSTTYLPVLLGLFPAKTLAEIRDREGLADWQHDKRASNGESLIFTAARPVEHRHPLTCEVSIDTSDGRIQRYRRSSGDIRHEWTMDYDSNTGTTSSWSFSERRDDDEYLRVVATVQSLKTNAILDAETFRPPFPANARVTDQIRKESFIARPDGTRRIITPAEQLCDPTYARLVATESGLACSPDLSRESKRTLLLVVGNVVFISLLALAWLWTRLRKRRVDRQLGDTSP